MPELTSIANPRLCDPRWPIADAKEKNGNRQAAVVGPAVIAPNALVCWTFFLLLVTIPFHRLYFPGTGERLGVTRMLQVLMLLSIFSQPRVCIAKVPTALLWFVVYYAGLVLWGFWTTPHLFDLWWPVTFALLQFALPCVWFLFNVLQYPGMGRRGLWAVVGGGSFCAVLHIAGVGVLELEGRSAVFGENANVLGATYALAVLAAVGLGMLKTTQVSGRLLLVPLVVLLGIGLAKTGSRTAALITTGGFLILTLQSRSFVPRIKRYAVLFLIVVGLAGVVYQLPAVYQRLATFRSSEGIANEPRAQMVPVLWEIFQRSPISGTGPADYQAELTRRAMPHWLKQHKTISSHNLLLLVLVETGVLGFLLYARAVGGVLKAGWRGRLHPCGFVPLAMFAPLLLMGMISCDPSPHPVFWVAIAYCLAGRG